MTDSIMVLEYPTQTHHAMVQPQQQVDASAAPSSDDGWLNWMAPPGELPFSEPLFDTALPMPAVAPVPVKIQEATANVELLLQQSQALLEEVSCPAIIPASSPSQSHNTEVVVEQAFGSIEVEHQEGEAPKFPEEELNDFKHVLYNLLAEHHNNPTSSDFVIPVELKEKATVRTGFKFNSRLSPDKLLPELYARHIRKARLDLEDSSSVFTHDLYKYYLRASIELLSKYFEKKERHTYFYVDQPLFKPGDTLEKAEVRIKNMRSRSRKRKRR